MSTVTRRAMEQAYRRAATLGEGVSAPTPTRAVPILQHGIRKEESLDAASLSPPLCPSLYNI